MIPVNTPLLEGNENKYLHECINTGWISSEGPFVGRFENEFAEKVNRKFGISVTNGTTALELAVKAIGIHAGDEVILPSFTIISCADAIVRAGATPVLVDCYMDTWNMDVSKIESVITEKTKAILAVHIYGLPAEMDLILAIAKKYDLKVIEDAAQMHGQTYKGKPCGSFGDVSTFSFYANKIITTGEGGMLLTNNEEIAKKARYYKNLCFNNETRFVHQNSGWNMRMTNLQAAVGVAQLEQLDKLVEKKRWIGNLYHELLGDIREFQLPIDQREYAENIYWVFGIVLNDCSYSVQEICTHLSKNKIGTRPFFWPMHEQPVYLKQGLFNDTSLPNSEFLARNGFYLPSGLGITETEIRTVAHCLKDFIND